MRSYYFCSYFDFNYLPFGLTLIRSLERHCEVPFTFYVLCLDQKTFNCLSKLNINSVVLIKLSEIEKWDKSLLEVKSNRTLIEYYFTLSPILPLYILNTFKVDIISSLDADIMFFSSPTAIYEELNSKSIYIPPGFAHGFCALDNENYIIYSCTKYRDGKNEITIKFDDKNLNIKWPSNKPIISAKDKK